VADKTLLEVKNELTLTRAAAEAELGTDPRYHAGLQMRRNAARQAVPKLEKTFATAFAKAGFPVFTDGDPAEFVRVAAEEGVEVLCMSVDAPFQELVDGIRASIGKTNTFGPHQFASLTSFLRNLAAKLEIVELPRVQLDEAVYLQNEAQLRAVVDKYVDRYGGEILAPVALQAEAIKLAEKATCKAPVIPVVFYGATEEKAERLGPKMFQHKHCWVSLPDEVDKKFVLTTLNTIKKTLKSKE
jgi:hypothetical protein